MEAKISGPFAEFRGWGEAIPGRCDLNGYSKLLEQPLLADCASGLSPWALSLVLFSSFLLFPPAGRTGHARDARQTRSKGMQLAPTPQQLPQPQCSPLAPPPSASCPPIKTEMGCTFLLALSPCCLVYCSGRGAPF